MTRIRTLLEGISSENLIRQMARHGKTWGLLFAVALVLGEATAWIYLRAPRAEKKVFLATPKGVDIDLVWIRFSPYLTTSFSKDLPKLEIQYAHRSGADTQRVLTLSVKSLLGDANKMSKELEQVWEKDLSDLFLKSLGLTILENQLLLRPNQDPLSLREKISQLQEQLSYYQRLVQDKPPLTPLVPFRGMDTNEKQNYFIPTEYHINALRLEMADLQKEMDFFKDHQAKNTRVQEAMNDIQSATNYSEFIAKKALDSQGKENSLWNDLEGYARSYRSFLIDSRTPAGPAPRKDSKIVYIQVFVVMLLIAMISLFLFSWNRKDETFPGK